MKHNVPHPARRSRRGSMLVVVALLLISMSGLALAALTVMRASSKLQRRDREHVHAHYVAQAGLAKALFKLRQNQSATLGTPAAPLVLDRSHYYVTQENLSAQIYRLTATGLDDRTTARQELVVRRLPSSVWRFGAFGREFVHMSSNARLDSYDSGLGSYASQAINGTGSSQHALSGGEIGSNGDITLDQNAKVWGNAVPGPQHQDTILGNATVSGTTGAAADPVDVPALSVPGYTSYGNLTVTSPTTVASGDRTYGNLSIASNKTLRIVGPANIVISNLQLRAGAKIEVDATLGNVQLYVIDNFVMNAGSQIAPTDFKPEHLRLNLLSDNVINPEVNVQLDTVQFDSNSKFYGTILAPNAAIKLTSNFELFGALVARSIDMASNARLHFDEALLDANGGAQPVFETISWRTVACPD
jgi:hypothetical protein